MKASQKLIDKIKEFEGCKLKAYQDSKGVWTIGYGTTSGVKPGMVIDKAKAEVFLDADVESFEHELEKIPVVNTLPVNKWDAILDFCYNAGVANFKSSTMLRKIKANPDDETIALEFGRWVYITKSVRNAKTGKLETKKIKLNGLVKRRAWESKRWQGLV